MPRCLTTRPYRAAAGLAERLRHGCADRGTRSGRWPGRSPSAPESSGLGQSTRRNLRVEPETARRLAPAAPTDAIVIAESGIETPSDVDALRGAVDGFLIGSAVMKAPDPDRMVRSLVYGETKVCGLTRPEDAAAAREAGATHGGLIFAAGSPRLVSEARPGRSSTRPTSHGWACS
ncbi:MAG: hypothetical protein R2909_20680 [Gemmatimonadales bacterium]